MHLLSNCKKISYLSKIKYLKRNLPVSCDKKNKKERKDKPYAKCYDTLVNIS